MVGRPKRHELPSRDVNTDENILVVCGLSVFFVKYNYWVLVIVMLGYYSERHVRHKEEQLESKMYNKNSILLEHGANETVLSAVDSQLKMAKFCAYTTSWDRDEWK